MRPEAPALDGEQVVVSWDRVAEVLEVRSWLPGPAGVVGIGLRGVDIEVDVAEPGLVALATVAGATIEAAPVLAALLGPQRASEALAVRGDGPVVLAAPEPSTTRRLGTPRGGPDPSSALARLALCRLDLDGPSLPLLARLAAHAEAAAAARLLEEGVDLGLAAGARADAAAAFALLGELGAPPDVELPDQATADELAAALRSAARLLGDDARPPAFRVRPDAGTGVAPRWAGAGGRQPAAAAMAAPASAAAPMVEKLARPAADEARRRRLAAVPTVVPVVAVDALDPVGLPAGAHARWRGPAELEVRAPAAGPHAAGWWARAALDDGTPLAVVPVRVDGGDAVARLLVPPAQAAALRVDLTHRPDVAPPSAAATAAGAALLAGVEACRAERLGERWRAGERWAESARRWDEAGDEHRSGRARAYAADRSREPGRATLADRLRSEGT